MAVGSDVGGGQQSCQERQRLGLRHCKRMEGEEKSMNG
jgi:hypothetical protein